MKLSSEVDAKIKVWARDRIVYRMPRIANLPYFGHKKFSSYAEFNEWQRAYQLELIRSGGAKWTH